MVDINKVVFNKPGRFSESSQGSTKLDNGGPASKSLTPYGNKGKSSGPHKWARMNLQYFGQVKRVLMFWVTVLSSDWGSRALERIVFSRYLQVVPTTSPSSRDGWITILWMGSVPPPWIFLFGTPIL